MHVVLSACASIRLREARKFLNQFPPGQEVLLLGASRGAVDDLARSVALEKGATFGFHRLSLTQFAARLAAPVLAGQGHSPASGLAYEAFAARAVFEAKRDEGLEYFEPVSRTPGFPRALARTALELRLADADGAQIAALPRSGADLANLFDRVGALMDEAGMSDRASLFAAATEALVTGAGAWAPVPTLLLDVPFDSEAEATFLRAILQRSPDVLLTVPEGDVKAFRYLGQLGVSLKSDQPSGDTDLARVSRYLFSNESPPSRQPTGELVWFSAPGEGRECVEIARRVLKEASRGVQFDEVGIFVRSPHHYSGQLEQALERAGIPAYFERGLRRPHPAGRAFLAILNCAIENLSAKRFAEYLSLGQVPATGFNSVVSPATSDSVVTSPEESFGVLSEPPVERFNVLGVVSDAAEALGTGALCAPWRWEALLVESAVIGGSERWVRRLDGLAEQYRLQIRQLTDEEPDSPRIDAIGRELENLGHLRAFALPLVEAIASWPKDATWGDWLQRLDGLAQRVLQRPQDVLRVLAGLNPMAAVGPVSLTEVRDVLADRLTAVGAEPALHRYGRVFVGSPSQARGRSFRVVFVPGLAERMFPERVREDPLLLDDVRPDVGPALARNVDRAEAERLQLRLAVGAAAERLYISFPRMETSDARARVPSLYALEIVRAVTGQVPSLQAIQHAAASESRARLGWPAPANADTAIDSVEHDLSVLDRLLRSGEEVSGRARYMLELNECLKRSVTERWARAEKRWTQFDGLVRVTDATRPFLETQRLSARAYSISALQKYAVCPYQFFLSAAYRFSPPQEPTPLQRMDPLTKGALFHDVQAECFRAVQKQKLAVTPEHLPDVFAVLDEVVARIAAEYRERLAPAVDRVWEDEVGAIRADLRVWLDRVAKDTEWEPWLFEFAFGLPDQPGHDPESRREPAVISDRFLLRGSVDLVERKRGANTLRVTDHKTSKNRSAKKSVIGNGRQLQPVIYTLAVEQTLGANVESARFSYCTTAGEFSEHVVPIDDKTRSMGVEVMEIIDRAVATGMLPPAPDENACKRCEFRLVCGPYQERHAKHKPRNVLGDLLELRGRA